MDTRRPPQWYVISLRPSGGHASMRRAAARRGAGLVALSPWRLVTRDDAGTRAALAQALRAPRVVFTSPGAVRAARAVCAGAGTTLACGDARWFGVGAGTLAALRRAGVATAQAPTRMDSEGLLAMPELRDVAGSDVGLVTAPGGRDAIGPALSARGARVHRADVYARVPLPPTPRALAALRQAAARPRVLVVSSAGALEQVLAGAPDDIGALLRASPVVVASQRLAAQARALGFDDVALAAGPRPAALVDAAHARASDSMPR